ncbi:MAG: DUF4349 domain-containing protein [Saprospiraceae bacterium]|nr:DUF4349 domain-containing protein [Saprospiraceae bacterium]
MKISFKGKIWKIAIIILCGFVVLFVFRFIYGYTSTSSIREDSYVSDFFEDGMTKRNYASDNYSMDKKGYDSKANYKDGDFETRSPKAESSSEIDINQKYEKTATIKSKTDNYADDKTKLENKIKDFNAIIQFEKISGNKGNRRWHLSIGVQPDKFDTLYDFIRKIGRLSSSEVTKVDKTNEFKNLNAKKLSLEKIRKSLIELQEQKGQIDEFINLQNRILEIESDLQRLGVLLGDFDEENEFCTIKYSLVEGSKPIPISTIHRIKVAFEWTVQYYFIFLLIVTLSTFSAFFILLIVDKLKVLSGIIKKLNEK